MLPAVEGHEAVPAEGYGTGRWLRIYKKSTDADSDDFTGWTQIYVISDTDVYAVYEENPKILLSDYLKQHDSVLYYLSPDEKTVYAVSKTTVKVLFSYGLEDSWSPSTEE